MDEHEFITDTFVNRDEPIPVLDVAKNQHASSGHGHSRSASTSQLPSSKDLENERPSTPKRRGLRERLAALGGKASLQDRLVEQLLAGVLQDSDGSGQDDIKGSPRSPGINRPNFNITTMSNNFRRFNSRIGVVFVFQARMIRLLTWRHPTHTMSFLAVYTFVCLDPYLLPVLPLALLLFGIMIPNFVARHPAAPFSLSSDQAIGYSPHGPPLAPPRTVKPVKELSMDFFRNLRDLQNSMEDFSQLHDGVITNFVPKVNFSDEALSTLIFVCAFAACLVLSISANVLPWRFICLALGWTVTVAGHPLVTQKMEDARQKHVKDNEEKAKGWVQKLIDSDIVLDGAAETREVEIFELQRLTGPDGEWEPWLFSPSPYDPLSAQRIAGERPTGTRFFEDVQAPPGWEWSEKKWTLDLWSREWVEERIITGVEVETEGERWVYDIHDESQVEKVGVAEESDSTPTKRKAKTVPPPRLSWEEGEDFEGRRGEWRRRRWVRLVKRKNLGSQQEVIS